MALAILKIGNSKELELQLAGNLNCGAEAIIATEQKDRSR
jgi:hypothetical protein